MAPPNRICIFLSGGIGDFVVALPALLRLRQAFPRNRISLVGNPLWLDLARESRMVDDAHSIDDLPLHAGFMSRLPQDHALRRFLAGFDLIISWFGDREGLWERNLKSATCGRVLVRPFRAVHTFPGHASDYYLTSLEELELPQGAETRKAREPLLRWRNQRFPGTRSSGEGPLEGGPFLGLHPGSGSETKNWPKENFLELARGTLLRLQLPCRVLLGPAEEEQKPFWAAARETGLHVMEGRSILEVCGILRKAALYVGNDSGITHLAAALGVPVVALFGPSDPARWAPRGDGVEILGQPISAEEVLSTVGRLHSSIIL